MFTKFVISSPHELGFIADKDLSYKKASHYQISARVQKHLCQQ